MKYFKKVDFDKCMEFLADKPETVETQQGLHNYMVYEHIYPEKNDVLVKNMTVYSKVLTTRATPRTANWVVTMSDGSQVIWNRKYQEFYTINEVGMERCDVTNYLSMFPEIKDIDTWLLENWSYWRFRETQKQLFAIWCGKYDQFFQNYWR